jgi:hypothetical protein
MALTFWSSIPWAATSLIWHCWMTRTSPFGGVETSWPSRTWFALAGCKRCAKSARKKGIAAITDVDGDMCLI